MVLSKQSPRDELLARREEIAEESLALQLEHRKIGAWLNAKDINVGDLKAEKARIEKIISNAESA